MNRGNDRDYCIENDLPRQREMAAREHAQNIRPARTLGSTAARTTKDHAIVQLWVAMRGLSDFGEDALTKQDMQLWEYVTGHDAVQSRLNKP